MSLVALAMRISAVKALQGATAAGLQIFDSALLPIDQLAIEDPSPFVAVSTEEEVSKPSGRDLNNGDRSIDFVIEIAVGKAGFLPSGEDEALLIVETDAGLETSLAIISRQVSACLFGAGGGQWGDVFRAFSKSIDEVTSRRGVPDVDGQRFASRQMIFKVRAFGEPAFDTAPFPDTPFAKFLAAAGADPTLNAITPIIRQAIEGRPIGWPDLYSRTAVEAGLSEAEAQSVGLDPIGGPISGVSVLPDGWNINQSEADEKA